VTVIPVLGIPALNRPDLLARHIESIDVLVDRLFVIDNSPHWEMGDIADNYHVEVVDPGVNLGVAASWNFIIKTNPAADWWMIANVDQEYAPGDLERLAAAMGDESAAVRCLSRFAAFAINRACVEKVGLFDENFHPIYCEDADYEYRCKLAGVEIVDVESGTKHLEGGSVTFRTDRQYADRNARTYPENVAYFEAKWGGPLRGGEKFMSPFDGGGPVDEWTLDVSRLRDLAWWTRTA
jgi:GT2 family glycosyltransferase